MRDALLIGFMFVGIPFVVIAFVTWILHYFVALTAPPKRRATWIVGIAYVLASAFWLFGGPAGDRWEGPIAALPGALLAYWFWQNDFSRDWIDDSEDVPDGVELANSDWRVGLLGVVMLFAIAALKVAVRQAPFSWTSSSLVAKILLHPTQRNGPSSLSYSKSLPPQVEHSIVIDWEYSSFMRHLRAGDSTGGTKEKQKRPSRGMNPT